MRSIQNQDFAVVFAIIRNTLNIANRAVDVARSAKNQNIGICCKFFDIFDVYAAERVCFDDFEGYFALLFELVERAQNRIVFVDAGKHSYAAFDNAEYRKIQGFRAVFCEYQRVFVACSEHGQEILSTFLYAYAFVDCLVVSCATAVCRVRYVKNQCVQHAFRLKS